MNPADPHLKRLEQLCTSVAESDSTTAAVLAIDALTEDEAKHTLLVAVGLMGRGARRLAASE